MPPAEPTPTADVQEIEILARTLAVEHEEAEKTKTQISVEPTLSLAAPYADRGEIARGGMGAVRRAFDDDLQRLVAIKVMLPSLNANESLAQRFIDEARITALIDHPNIAPVYRLAKGPDGALSLVMKLIEGRTFSSYLREFPPPALPPSP